MEKRGIINLFNRDHADLRLELLTGNTYQLSVKTPEKFGYVLNHLRCGISDKDNKIYSFIDPPGGPMICIGDKIDNRTVEKIYYSNEFKKIVIDLSDK